MLHEIVTIDFPLEEFVGDTHSAESAGRHDAEIAARVHGFHEIGRLCRFDVILDKGYSELALRRSENTGLLAQGGYPALVEAMDQKIAALQAES